MRFLLAISLIVAISSCSDLNRPAQLERLNKMEEIVENSAVLLNDNKIENSIEVLSISTEYIEKLKGLEDDTIQLDIAYKLDRFKTMYDGLKPVLTNYKELEETVRVEKAALKKLKNDISHSYGKRHKYDEYLSFEEKKVAELESAIALYVEQKQVIVITYDELHNEINQILVERFPIDKVQ